MLNVHLPEIRHRVHQRRDLLIARIFPCFILLSIDIYLRRIYSGRQTGPARPPVMSGSRGRDCIPEKKKVEFFKNPKMNDEYRKLT